MTVTRQDCSTALSRLRPDRMGILLGSEPDLSTCAQFARQMLPVLAQAEALFWEFGGATDTPAQAALALALHATDPALFDFPNCHCRQYKIRPPCSSTDGQCARNRWVLAIQRQARAPKAKPLTWREIGRRLRALVMS
jgi:hypothetical protein